MAWLWLCRGMSYTTYVCRVIDEWMDHDDVRGGGATRRAGDASGGDGARSRCRVSSSYASYASHSSYASHASHASVRGRARATARDDDGSATAPGGGARGRETVRRDASVSVSSVSAARGSVCLVQRASSSSSSSSSPSSSRRDENLLDMAPNPKNARGDGSSRARRRRRRRRRNMARPSLREGVDSSIRRRVVK